MGNKEQSNLNTNILIVFTFRLTNFLLKKSLKYKNKKKNEKE